MDDSRALSLILFNRMYLIAGTRWNLWDWFKSVRQIWLSMYAFIVIAGFFFTVQEST